METYEESVELTRTFVKIESTNPGTEEAAMREAILAYLKDTSCKIQLDDVGNGRKNVIIWRRNRRAEWNFTNVWQRKLRYEVRTCLCISDF